MRTMPASSLASFVGREEELRAIARAFAGGARVVTLVGAPGVGKSRLAAAHGVRASGPTLFHDAASLTDPRHLSAQLARALGGEARPGKGADDLGRRLERRGPTLLLLDNFDGLTGAADLIATWARAAPELSVLITSRARLGTAGEHVMEVEPLGCPDEGADDEAILTADAVRLMLRRIDEAAGAALPLGVVARMVRLLEGVPLAIELAAIDTRVLGADALLRRLHQGQRAFGHPTLEAAIESSWARLDAELRGVLARCSILEGPFTPADADAIVGVPAIRALLALRDRSLVRATPAGELQLLESIRTFARDKLEAMGKSAAHDARRRHALHFADLARRFVAGRCLLAPEDRGFAAFRAQHANLTAALRAVDELCEGDGAASARAWIAGAIARAVTVPDRASLELVSTAMQGLEGERLPEELAQLLLVRQRLLLGLGEPEASERELARVHEVPGLPKELAALAHHYRGIVARDRGDVDESWESHLRSDELLADGAYPRLHAMNCACLARIAMERGADARSWNERAVARCEIEGDSLALAIALVSLAQVEQEAQSFDLAEQLFDRAMAILRALRETHYELYFASMRADLAQERGQPEQARWWYRRAEQFAAAFPLHKQACMSRAASAALDGALGDRSVAALRLGQAALAASCPASRLVLELHRAAVTMDRAPMGEAAEVARRHAFDLLTMLQADHRHLHDTSFDVRFAARMLRRRIGARRPGLRVGPQAAWFAWEGGENVALERRGSLRRIVHLLVSCRLAQPGQIVDAAALVAAGWPGERLMATAAASRMRVAIATLRRMGLREALATRNGGYVLRADVEVIRIDDAPTLPAAMGS